MVAGGAHYINRDGWLRFIRANCVTNLDYAMNDDHQLLVGRLYGGIDIMWRTNIYHACNVVNLNDVKLLGIDVDTIEGKIFLLNVYLPYQSSDNYEEYCNYLGKIASIIEEKDSNKIVIAGDFNAAVNSRFETELLDIGNNFDLVICDYEVFGRTSGTFTYVSDAHNYTSWLDHFICSHGVQSLITNIYIIDKLPSSDHLPVGLVYVKIEVQQHTYLICFSTTKHRNASYNVSKYIVSCIVYVER